MAAPGDQPHHVQQQHSDEEDEAFIAGDEGLAVDGEVLDDLVGEGMDHGESSEPDEDGGPSTSGHGGDDMHDDDSWHCFEGHTDAVLAVAWSPAPGNVVATGGVDDRAFLWRVGQEGYEATAGTLDTHELTGHTDTVVALAFNHTGSLLGTASLDGTVRVWSGADGALVQVCEGPAEGCEWLAWHPKGDVVLAGSEDFSVWMWLAQSGQCMQVFSGHCGPVSAGCFTPDGKTVITAGGEGDASLRLWNPKTGECTAHLVAHPFHDDAITALACHQDGTVVVTGGVDGSLRVTTIIGGSCRVVASPEGHEDSVEAVGFCRQQPLAASAGVDGQLMIWDTHTFTARGTCRHEQPVTRLAWHPQQPLVASACLDGGVRLWDLRTASCVRTWWGHSAGVQDVVFSRDGSWVLSGGDDNSARVFQCS